MTDTTTRGPAPSGCTPPVPPAPRGSARRRVPRRGRALAAAGIVAVVAGGCGSGAAPTSTPATTGLPTSVAAPSTGSAGPAPAPAAGTPAPATGTVVAKLTEYKIGLSRTTLAAGAWTFDAVNAGTTVHALSISGPGVAAAGTPGTVQPGASERFTVTLKAGSYDVYCPVPGHRALGMDTKVTVTGSGPSTAAPGAAAPGAPAAAPTTVARSGY